MTKKTEAPDFMAMFSQLGKDMKLPSVDVESILSHHKKNLEALQKAASASAASATSIFEKQRAVLEEGMSDLTEMMQNLHKSSAPQEAIAKQTEFVRKSFENAVRNAGEVGEILRKSGEESADIMRERIKTAMDEIRAVYEKKG